MGGYIFGKRAALVSAFARDLAAELMVSTCSSRRLAKVFLASVRLADAAEVVPSRPDPGNPLPAFFNSCPPCALLTSLAQLCTLLVAAFIAVQSTCRLGSGIVSRFLV